MYRWLWFLPLSDKRLMGIVVILSAEQAGTHVCECDNSRKK